MTDPDMDREKRDIEHVSKLLDRFYADAVGRNYPYLRLDEEDVPEAMVGDRLPDGTIVWKLLQSTISDKEIDDLEAAIGHRFPPMYRAYLKSLFHLFEQLHPYDITDSFNGHRSGSACLDKLPSENPFWRFDRAIHPDDDNAAAQVENRLLSLGFIPIGWNIYETFVLDTNVANDEGDCQVVIIPQAFFNEFHESQNFDLEDVAKFVFVLCASFREFVGAFIRYPEWKRQRNHLSPSEFGRTLELQ